MACLKESEYLVCLFEFELLGVDLQWYVSGKLHQFVAVAAGAGGDTCKGLFVVEVVLII